MPTITRICPRRKKHYKFKIINREHNQKIICEECGLKIFAKPNEKIKENLDFYFNYKFLDFKEVKNDN